MVGSTVKTDNFELRGKLLYPNYGLGLHDVGDLVTVVCVTVMLHTFPCRSVTFGPAVHVRPIKPGLPKSK